MDSRVKGEKVISDNKCSWQECSICNPPWERSHIETQLQDIAATTALLARQLGLHQKAQALIEDVFGPDCALCGQPSHNSFRTDTNVHADCWRREKGE